MQEHDSKSAPKNASGADQRKVPLSCLLADIEGQITSIQRIITGINDLLIIENPETTYRRNKSALELSWYLESLTSAVSATVLQAIETHDAANAGNEGV
ncbi:hypothetical protein FB480_101864 [Agrobacterium vitis]|nr:hypothetical protein FB480_101864 [Agrobacterium vitis]